MYIPLFIKSWLLITLPFASESRMPHNLPQSTPPCKWSDLKRGSTLFVICELLWPTLSSALLNLHLHACSSHVLMSTCQNFELTEAYKSFHPYKNGTDLQHVPSLFPAVHSQCKGSSLKTVSASFRPSRRTSAVRWEHAVRYSHSIKACGERETVQAQKDTSYKTLWCADGWTQRKVELRQTGHLSRWTD